MPFDDSGLKVIKPRSFECDHRFVAKKEASFSFVCESCGYRIDDLPVVRLRRTTARVLQFSSARR